MTILIIDDEAMIRTMARKILVRHGFEVIAAEGGASGIDVLTRHGDAIGLVLLDWTMPDMSGEETLRKIRTVAPQLPCIISSGHALADDVVPEELRDYIHFLEKPYRAGQLVRQVELVLAGQRLPT